MNLHQYRNQDKVLSVSHCPHCGESEWAEEPRPGYRGALAARGAAFVPKLSPGEIRRREGFASRHEKCEKEQEPARSYRDARGALPWQLGDPLPEEVIRRMRDADNE